MSQMDDPTKLTRIVIDVDLVAEVADVRSAEERHMDVDPASKVVRMSDELSEIFFPMSGRKRRKKL